MRPAETGGRRACSGTIDVHQLRDLLGIMVFDSEHEPIGTVEEIFYGEATTGPLWVGVATDRSGNSRMRLPLAGGTVGNGGLTLAYTTKYVPPAGAVAGDIGRARDLMQSISLKARSERLDGTHVILLEGEADAFTAPVAKDALENALRAEENVIVIDLTGVTFIDSTMLGIFIDASRLLRARGGVFGIACADEHIKKVFRITGLDGVIQVYESAREAVSSLTKARGTCN